VHGELIGGAVTPMSSRCTKLLRALQQRSTSPRTGAGQVEAHYTNAHGIHASTSGTRARLIREVCVRGGGVQSLIDG
jgi:hypothetical protein